MALSNWAILGIDQDGLTEGELVDEKLGYTIEIYKSWVYVRDPAGHREGNSYKDDVVMKIDDTSGLTYQRMCLDVWKPVSNEVYVAARTGYYHDEDSDVNVFLGCGVYGYEGEDWVGVTDSQLERLDEHLSNTTVVRRNSISIPNDVDGYNFGDLNILERSGVDADVEELYEDNEDPMLQQAFEEEDED